MNQPQASLGVAASTIEIPIVGTRLQLDIIRSQITIWAGVSMRKNPMFLQKRHLVVRRSQSISQSYGN